MKLGIISDIHLDINKDYPVLDVMCDTVQKKGCEGLILAGDISDGAETSLKWLEKIKNSLSVPLWFVPGNHDMWDAGRKFRDTWHILEEYKKLEGCLDAGAVPVSGNGLLVGNIGWYDYSLGDSAYTSEQFNQKTHAGRTWQDSLFAHWETDDREVCRAMLQELSDTIKKNKDKKIIAVTHMIGIPEFQVPTENNIWDYFNAFLGNSGLGKLYEEEQIYGAVMGHVHYRKQVLRNGVDYRCACLGYHTEWPGTDLVSEMEESMQCMEV